MPTTSAIGTRVDYVAGPHGQGGKGLPQTIGVGVTWNDHFQKGPLACWTPVSSPQASGRVLNLHSYAPSTPLPTRFIIGDGAYVPFTGIDQTPGSKLSTLLDAAVADMRQAGATSLDGAARYLMGSGRYAMRFPHSMPAAPPSPPAQWAFLSSQPTNQPIGAVVSTPWEMAVRDFAEVAGTGRGSCFMQSLWNALVLQRLGIPCAVRAGRMARLTTGHNWVELADGRILDGGNRHFLRPVPTGTPNHFTVNGSLWFAHPAWAIFDLG